MTNSPRFEICVARVLVSEGGDKVTNIPGDSGSWTKYGITLATLGAYRGQPQMPSDIQNLSQADAEEIYHANYWTPVDGDSLPTGVDYAVFDFAVNSGVKRAVMTLQSSVGAVRDGVLGPHTLASVASAKAATVILSMKAQRIAFYQNIATSNVNDRQFLNGWMNRVDAVTQAALADAA